MATETAKKKITPVIVPERIDKFINVFTGKTSLRSVTARSVLPDGQYYGRFVIDQNDNAPVTEIIPLTGNDVLTMVRMDVRDLTGEDEYQNVMSSFNTSFAKVLSDPKQWDKEFILNVRNVPNRQGVKYSQAVIDETIEVEV